MPETPHVTHDEHLVLDRSESMSFQWLVAGSGSVSNLCSKVASLCSLAAAQASLIYLSLSTHVKRHVLLKE